MLRLGQQLARNILASWAGYFTRIVITFFFIPYITMTLGEDRYGVWVILFQVVGYLSLLDFGLERAVVRHLSKFLGQKDFAQLNRVLNTSTTLYLMIGSLVIIAAWLTSTYLFGYFKIPEEILAEEGRQALLVIGIYAGVRFMLWPFGGHLGSFQRSDIANGLGMAEDIIRTLILVWLLSQGYGLVALALCVLSTTVLRMMVGVVLLKKIQPSIRFNPSLTNSDTVRSLFSYSKVSFGITLSWLVVFGTDSILLGLLSSTAAAGIYAPGAGLMLYLRHVVNAIGTPLTPAISHLEAVGNKDAIKEIYTKATKYLAYLSFFIATGVVFYAPDFVDLWLAPEFAGSAPVMIVLSIGLAVFLPQIIGNAILFGIEQHRYLLRVLILEAALKLILSIMLIDRYGLIGMAWGTAIPQVLLYLTLYPYHISRVLGIRLAPLLLNTARMGLTAAMVTSLTSLAMRAWLAPANWPMFAANIIAVTLVAGLVFMWLFDHSDRSRLVGYLSGKY